MRITLAIDDDVLAAAKGLAATQGKTLGEVISLLARRTLLAPDPEKTTRNGVPLLPTGPNTRFVTSELVQQFREGLL